MISETINKNGILVKVGDLWTMHSPANKFFPDRTWIMRIDGIQKNGIIPVTYVNWKRRGIGKSYSRTIEDFGSFENLKKSTSDEIKYFNDRLIKLKLVS